MTINPFECPITLETMKDPVLAPDGHTYERLAITKWIVEHGTSPQTRQHMRVNQLLPNRAIADLLQQSSHVATATTATSETVDHGSGGGETNVDIATNAKARSSTTLFNESDVKRIFVPDELASVVASTHATLHVLRSEQTSSEESVSARVHIKAPNPSADQVDKSLTAPHHICCVIDVSGSMGCMAISKDESGNVAENRGLSILDIVKFSTLVIAKSLNPQDKLSIVTYGDRAILALQATNMTSEGKRKVESTLRTIPLQTRTNLFAGIKLGITQANSVGCEFINSVFVLTDGVPTEHPPLGYERSMAKVLSKNPICGTISTFGFGYELDSKLLVDIAKIGGGYYSFIPDAGMVGTCFINALANCRCAFGIQPVLKISGCDLSHLTKSGKISGISLRKNITGEIVTGITQDGCLGTTLVDNDIYVRLTPLRYGSDIDVMLKPTLFKKNMEDIKIELIFDTVDGVTMNLDVLPTDGDAADQLLHSQRTQFVNKAYNMCLNPYDNMKRSTFSNIARDNNTENSNLDALYQDMRGQATEAIEDRAHFVKWGKHFLLSLSMAHLHQFCNNFKDPGVQVYGEGLLFSSLQSSLDDIFEQIPLPVPSADTGPVRKIHPHQRPMTMTKVYNNRCTVCVHGKTILTVKKSSQKTDSYNDNAITLLTSSPISYIPIRAIQKGDLVLTSNGTYAKVDCLVETVVDDKTLQPPFELVKVGQLCVTPYHPVKLNEHSGWQFPIHTSDSNWMVPNDDQYAAAYSVYNLVLERGQRHKAVLMDGIETITLGHGITNDATLQHSYFGTDKVISDLVRVDGGTGWMNGHISLRESDVSRDAASGCICHISDVKVAVDEGATIMNNYAACAPCTA